MIITENTRRDGDYIVGELANATGSFDYCREHVTLTQDADPYLPGTVLKDDGAGKAIRWDGTGDVLGILFAARDATDADERAVASVRGTVYKIPLLVWGGAITAAQKTAAMEQMKSSDLIGRTAA